MITLKELVKNVKIEAEIVDIAVWDETKEDREYVMGFDGYKENELQEELWKISKDENDDRKKFLDYEIHDIDVYTSGDGAIMLIEIVSPVKSETVYTIELVDEDMNTQWFDTYKKLEDAIARCEEMGWTWKINGKTWRMAVYEDHDCY